MLYWWHAMLLLSVLSWFGAASKTWAYAWTADELEPACEPRLVLAQPSSHPRFPSRGIPKPHWCCYPTVGKVGGGSRLLCIFLDEHTCLWSIPFNCLMFVKREVTLYLRRWQGDLVSLGWQVSRCLLQAPCYLLIRQPLWNRHDSPLFFQLSRRCM